MMEIGVARHALRNARSCRGSPRGDGCSEDGRGACRDRTPAIILLLLRNLGCHQNKLNYISKAKKSLSDITLPKGKSYE